MEFVEQHQASDRANALHRLQPPKSLWIRLPHSDDELALEITDGPIIEGNEGQIDFSVFLHCWIGKALGNPLTLRFGLEWLASRGQIVLGTRLADMVQPLRALAD